MLFGENVVAYCLNLWVIGIFDLTTALLVNILDSRWLFLYHPSGI